MSGFAGNKTFAALASVLADTDLLIMAARAPHGDESIGPLIAITLDVGEEFTWDGLAESRADVEALFGSVCHPEAVRAACDAWQVTIIDLEWGRNDVLWPALERFRSGEPVTTLGSDDESPREEMAANAAEAYAELTAYADSPEAPERARQIMRRLASLLADQAAEAAHMDIRLAREEQATADIEALLYGDDTSVIVAALKGRLTREKLADLIVRLDSPA